MSALDRALKGVELKTFQAANGLKPDGIAGPLTWAAIWRSLGVDLCVDHKSLTHWGVRKTLIEAIIVHHSCTSNPAQTARILEQRELSTHYEVSATGQVYEYGDPLTQVAWHCGGSVNGRSIGIDLTHLPGKKWPEAQTKALAALLKALCLIHGLPAVVAPDRSLGRGGLNPAWGVYRHRNLAATACPENLVLESCFPA
jgi:hypothetical protein